MKKAKRLAILLVVMKKDLKNPRICDKISIIQACTSTVQDTCI